MGQPYQNNPYGQQFPPQYGQPVADPFAGAADNADPFADAVPDQRAGRVAMADQYGQPMIHSDREPIMVTPPSLRTLGVGRLLFIVPKRIERNIPDKRPNAWRPQFDRLTADLIVVDGGAFQFGGDPTRGIADMLTAQVPCVVEDIWIDKAGIIERVPENLIGRGFKIGRIVKKKTSNDRTAWNFDAPDEDPAKTSAIIAQLRASGIWEAYQNQQLPIYSLKTLAERYGVKPGADRGSPQQAAPTYNMTPPVAPVSPYLPQGAAVMNQAPQWPPMQPGQFTAPVQQAPGQFFGQVGDPRTDAVPPYQGPPGSGTAALADWTLQVQLPPALAPFQAQWASLTPQNREMMLAQAGVVNPNAQQGVPPMAAQQAGPGQPPPF